MSHSHNSSWFFHTRDIQPHRSAVLNGNLKFFYFVHVFGLILIAISMVLCALVIVSIRYRLKKEHWDFSDRFPFYVAVTDFLWGASHISDHLILLVTHKYPSKEISLVLSITGFTFFGYQQMMHISLASYVYLKVVKRQHFDLGRGEWKLHAFSIAFPVIAVLVFVGLDGFGPSGYWFLLNPNSTSGKILAYLMALYAFLHAIGVSVAYKQIQRAIDAQHEAMTVYKCKAQFLELPSQPFQVKKALNRRHSVATQCLTSFIRVYMCLFFPLAVTTLVIAIQYSCEVIEPITTISGVIIGNICGGANALSYFYNEHIKKKSVLTRNNAPTPSTVSANSNFTSSNNP